MGYIRYETKSYKEDFLFGVLLGWKDGQRPSCGVYSPVYQGWLEGKQYRSCLTAAGMADRMKSVYWIDAPEKAFL